MKLFRNARIQMDLSKKNCFSAEEAKITFLVPRKERRYLYMKCLSSLVFLHDSNFIMETEVAYRGSSTIPP